MDSHTLTQTVTTVFAVLAGGLLAILLVILLFVVFQELRQERTWSTIRFEALRLLGQKPREAWIKEYFDDDELEAVAMGVLKRIAHHEHEFHMKSLFQGDNSPYNRLVLGVLLELRRRGLVHFYDDLTKPHRTRGVLATTEGLRLVGPPPLFHER